MTSAQETILYLNNVSVSFDGFKAIDELSLVVERNELRCIIGPNGAGKTTMMDIITGKTKCDTGEVVFAKDIDLTSKDEAQIANLGIGRKFQKPTVFESMSVFDNLNLALEGHRGIWQTLFYKLTGERISKIEETLAIIGLSELGQMRAGELSHGQKQWLEIGMLIAQNPEVLMIDEPVAGMTHQESERTAELLIALADKHNHCVIVVEHDMEFVRSIARKVTVLHQGSVLAEGSMESIQNNPKVRDVYLGD